MTFLEAITAVEEELTKLDLKDYWGDPIVGIEASGIVAVAIGKEWDDCVNTFETNEIAPEVYFSKIKSLINQYSRTRFSSQIDSLLGQLKADQIELDIPMQANHEFCYP